MKVFLFFLIFLLSNHAFSSECEFPSLPNTILKNKEILIQSWEFPERKIYWKPTQTKFKALDAFRNEVKNKIDTNIISIFKRQQKFEKSGDQKNIDLLLTKKIGQLRPINCLESIVFNLQALRKPMFTHPTEFVVYAMTKRIEGKTWWKILFYTINRPYIGRVGPIQKQVKLSQINGWKLDFSLHNHNFNFSENNYRGGVAPSIADSGLYQNEKIKYGLRRALVTNGFTTSEIMSEDFHLLSTKN